MMKIFVRILFAIITVLASLNANSASCTLVSTTCVDSSPSKVVSGITVTLADAGGCWEYQDDYKCIAPLAVDYCAPFQTIQGCFETGVTCAVQDTTFNTGCMVYTHTWRCSNSATATPANTIKLADTYTLVSSAYNPAPCQALNSNPSCAISSTTCTSTTPPVLPNGISPSQVAPDGCYQQTNTYACATGQPDQSECLAYSSDPNCTLNSSVCAPNSSINNQCVAKQNTYKCETQPGSIKTLTDCSQQCTNGVCIDTSYPKDNDFAKTVALMEASRQAGTYMDPATQRIFDGVDSRCSIKLFNISNCCKSSGGGGSYSNGAMFQVAVTVGVETLSYGSRYVYDTLFQSQTSFLSQGMAALTGTDPTCQASLLNGWSPSFSLYGFTATLTSSATVGAAAGGGMLSGIAGSVGLSLPSAVPLGSFSGFSFAFDPTSFAIAIGMQILQDLLSCDQQEKIVAMRNGQNLCRFVGQYCSNELNLLVGTVCLEHTRTHCCYNSRLARILNEQGRGQIRKGWGSAEAPSCSGFTVDEFAGLDFSQIDMTEFTNEIMSNVKLPNVSNASQNAQGVIQNRLQNYYSNGSQK